ncbi:hypothetical protein [Algibacter sp. R77976]|uniref:hypothetical protein n=1 Tax=Algibacter sp. R77976 TaxID=3093873 RepID=UPI0037C8196E
MKFLIILLSLVTIQKSCDHSKINQDNISLEYTASSRNTYKLVLINKKTISLTTKRGRNPIVKYCNEENWNSIIKLLQPINVETISALEPPSKDHQFDGAAMARLKIIYDGNTYKTQSFDHGNAPEEIEALVKEILSIAENIE